jgi:DNA polymerase-3 subunit delta'
MSNWPTSKTTSAALNLALKKPSHSYIFYGPQGVGTYNSALLFAAILLNIEPNIKPDSIKHSNLAIIEPEEGKKNISIAQIHNLIRKVSQSPLQQGLPQVVILMHADTLSLDASAALLKTLEEPPGDVIFILTTHKLQVIINTIRSRCSIITFLPLSQSELTDYLITTHSLSTDKAKELSTLSNGLVDVATELLDENYLNEYMAIYNSAQNFVFNAISEKFAIAKQISEDQKTGVFLEKLVYATEAQSSILVIASNQESILAAEKQIQSNVNPRLVLENLALQWSS